MTRPWPAIIVALGALVGVLACARPSWAIPAFARRYETSCSTCHTQFPNLNPFGEAFRRNGYQFPAGGDTEAIKQAPMTLVSEARRDLFPRSDWPTDLARFPPLAFVVNGLVPMFPDASTRPADEQAVSFDRMFAQATVLLGARAGDHVAVFALGELPFERPGAVPAWVHRLLEHRPGRLAPRARGPIRAADFLLLELPPHRRAELPDPERRAGARVLLPHARAVRPGGEPVGNGRWALRVGRGLGPGRRGAELRGESARQLPARRAYGHVFARLGGMRLDGVEATRPAPGEPTGTDASLDLGAFVYGGEHDVDADNNPATPPENDVVAKVGGDALARLGDVSVLLAAAWERHSFQTVPVQVP